MIRTEQQVIRKSHPLYKTIDKMCFNSKNLYNYANYILRQQFINGKEQIPYMELNKQLKHTEDYISCMSQPANCVLRKLYKNWKSFFVAIKDYSKNPQKYLGKPKIPKYLKSNGRFVWEIPNNSCYIDGKNLRFRIKILQKYNWKTKAKGRLLQVRFVPMGSCYIMEIVTEIKNEVEFHLPNKIISIDLGVDNFATVTNNIGLQPIIINGKQIKSINQFYNKRKSEIQSNLMLRNKVKTSKKLEVICFKRYQRIKNYIHNASRYIINYCLENNIDTLVCGKNDLWKQNTQKKKVGQNFQYIPYNLFIQQLKYKCEENGINFYLTEESYTSGTSFLDNESPCKENYNKSRRIKRDLFQSKNGLINSDVNGSLQIMKKVFPNAFSYGIEGCLTPIIINII